MTVHWTNTALEHPAAIHSYVSQSSPTYAQRVVDRLTRRSQQIGEFPMSGRTLPELEIAQIREVIEGPFRIVSHIKPDQIDVLAVIHGARHVPWAT